MSLGPNGSRAQGLGTHCGRARSWTWADGGRDWVGDWVGDGDGVGNEVGDGDGVGVKDADEENVTVLLWMRISRISAA